MRDIDIFVSLATLGLVLLAIIVSVYYLCKYRHKCSIVTQNLYVSKAQDNGGPNPCDHTAGPIELIDIVGIGNALYTWK